MEYKNFIHIKPGSGWRYIDLRELLKSFDLFYFLILRDIKIRYKQTILGGLWAILQPFLSMIVLTFFFGRLAHIPSEGVPYPAFNYCAMMVWAYFSNTVNYAGNSIILNSSLISKVYFPRLLIPSTQAIAGLLDFAIAFVMFLIIVFYYHIPISSTILFAPLFIILMITTAIGVGAFLAALNAKYRDIRLTVPLMLQLWMFASPIVYPASIVPGKIRIFYALNPMVGIIEGFRASLLGTAGISFHLTAISAGVSMIVFTGGIFYFKQTENFLADIV